MSEAILDAAEDLLRRDADGTGIPPLTLGDVAEKVGLARSSLYRYHAGVEDLIEAVAMRGFHEWVDGIRDHVSATVAADGPRAGILAFLEDSVRRGPAAELRWRNQLLRVHLDELAHRRASESHRQANAILVECVAALPGLDAAEREVLGESLRFLICGAVIVVADHPGDMEVHLRHYRAAVEAMVDAAGGN